MTRGLFLTGPPGSGKTTIINKIYDKLVNMGCRVKGIYAPEIRVSGRRTGFQLCLLHNKKCWDLARIDCISPIRVGRYGVCLEEIAEAARTIIQHVLDADIVIIDEIGPMELASKELRKAIISILKMNKPVIGVIHRKLKWRDPQIYDLVRNMGPIITVTRENRETIGRQAVDYARVLADEICNSKRGESTTTDT